MTKKNLIRNAYYLETLTNLTHWRYRNTLR